MLKSEDQTRVRTLDLHGAFVRRTDLSRTVLRGANMAGMDATNAIFRDADFEGASLDGAILRGADLTGAKNLTLTQLSHAILDGKTLLPKYIDRDELRDLTKQVGSTAAP